MSRKDKYETNNRRQQTFMSAEDVAAGRKSSWQGVEITGNYHFMQSMMINGFIMPFH
jgi:CCR4-NOT transcription complex subunit 6